MSHWILLFAALVSSNLDIIRWRSCINLNFSSSSFWWIKCKYVYDIMRLINRLNTCGKIAENTKNFFFSLFQWLVFQIMIKTLFIGKSTCTLWFICIHLKVYIQWNLNCPWGINNRIHMYLLITPLKNHAFALISRNSVMSLRMIVD